MTGTGIRRSVAPGKVEWSLNASFEAKRIWQGFLALAVKTSSENLCSSRFNIVCGTVRGGH
jgi:hypothetical protein